MLDRLVVQLDRQGERSQAAQDLIGVPTSPSLQLGGNDLTELDPQAIGRGLAARTGRLTQASDARIFAHHFGQDGLLPVESLDTKLDEPFESPQEGGKLLVPGLEESGDERLVALEDGSEAKGEHCAAAKRRGEHLEVAQEIASPRPHSSGGDRARQGRELTEVESADACVTDAARLLPRVAGPDDAITEEGRGADLISTAGGGILHDHGPS